MAANQTIIQAVKSAYAHHEVDYSPIIQSMANTAQTLANMQEDASKKIDELNSAFNVLDFVGNEELESFAYGVRNDKSISHQEKLSKLKEIKNSMSIMDTWSESVKEIYKDGGTEISGAMNELESSWHTSLITGKYYGPNSVQDQNNDGEISEEEFKLKPVKFKNGKMMILNWDGGYVTTDQLKSKFPKKSDSSGLYDDFLSATKVKQEFNKNDIEDHVQTQLDILEVKMDEDPAAYRSFIFDKKIRVDDGDTKTFVEYFLENYDVSSLESQKILNLLKEYTAKGMSPGGYKILDGMLFKQIVAEEGVNVKVELLKFMKRSMEHKLNKKYSS